MASGNEAVMTDASSSQSDFGDTDDDDAVDESDTDESARDPYLESDAD